MPDKMEGGGLEPPLIMPVYGGGFNFLWNPNSSIIAFTL